MSTTKPPAGGKPGKKGSILKDKRVLYGIAGVGAVGLVVLFKKGGGAATADGGGTAGQPISPANLDSSGTDNYNAIASIGQAWQDQWTQAFGQFSDQLGGISDQLGAINGPTAGVPTTPPGKEPTAHPSTGPAGHGTGKNWGWYQVRPGDSYATIEKKAGVSSSNLFAFNTKNALNRLSVGEWVKTRSAAGPRPG